MASGEQIQQRLRKFAERWRHYVGSERAEAQTYLNELFGCYGSDRQDIGARFEDFRASAGFMDLHWPEVCIFEMKAPTKELSTGRDQVERYWRESSDPDKEVAAARWVVLCSFHKFEIWEPGRFPSKPRLTLTLDELPDKYEALGFLAAPNVEPNFAEHYRELTKEAARLVSEVYHLLKDRSAAPGDEIKRFVLQSVWCMFAEDLGMLDGYPFHATLHEVRAAPDRSAAELGFLFRVLNQKGSHNRKGRLAGTRYVNGELFAQPAEVRLSDPEIRLLIEATEFDWRKVDPTIFGSLMEGVLGRDRRWELGAHYTHEVDIMKIVTPTIIRPWRRRIENAASPEEAHALLHELCSFRVLDPACGCGNFLYVAYRELRKLEHELKERIESLARDSGKPLPPRPWPYFPLANMRGIDIERSAVLIARVTLWMGHRQMIDLYGDAEAPLPLIDLSGIQVGDALRVPWPETDCIIGNPPFLGDRSIRRNFGNSYIDWLSREFRVGIKDHCVYWFRRATDHLLPGQRAGLVGTNSISQNRARSASLQYVIDRGGVITDAVSTQKWPGDAKVHVSMANWIMQPKNGAVENFYLDGVGVTGIGADLAENRQRTWVAAPLKQNSGKAFYGPVPIGKGFILKTDEADSLISKDPKNSNVVRPFLTGADIVAAPEQTARRWCIDFGTMPLEEARTYPDVLRIVRERVKPTRESNRRESYRRRWWQFGEPCIDLRHAIKPLSRFIVGLSTGKRASFCWAESGTSMNNSTVVFAFDDDFSMGVLLSRAHGAWAWSQASTLKGDLRYTPTSVFSTFPWPDSATDIQREEVSAICRKLLRARHSACTTERIGLTELYNRVDEGAYVNIKKLHLALDRAVVDCYGWPKSIAQDDAELFRCLNELNRDIAEGERTYTPFS